MKKRLEKDPVIVDILQDTFFSLFQTLAPKLYKYRFNSKLVEKVALQYLQGAMDNLLVLRSQELDDQDFKFNDNTQGQEDDGEASASEGVEKALNKNEQYPPNLHYSVTKIDSEMLHPKKSMLDRPSLANYKDERIYVFGGFINKTYQNTMRYYDIAKNKWVKSEYKY